MTSLVKVWELPFLDESKMSDKQDIVTPRLAVICVCVHLAKSDLIKIFDAAINVSIVSHLQTNLVSSLHLVLHSETSPTGRLSSSFASKNESGTCNEQRLNK